MKKVADANCVFCLGGGVVDSGVGYGLDVPCCCLHESEPPEPSEDCEQPVIPFVGETPFMGKDGALYEETFTASGLIGLKEVVPAPRVHVKMRPLESNLIQPISACPDAKTMKISPGSNLAKNLLRKAK